VQPVQATPEQRARRAIDEQLIAAGWIVQSPDEFNRNAAEGVAVREFALPNGPCDYLLFVGGKAAGVIEAKKAGHTLSGVAEQSAKYMVSLPEHLARWADQLIFDYESTGDETYFRDTRDPSARSRRVFAFHQPQTLHAWLQEPDTLRRRLQQMPPLDTAGLRDCQVDAVNGLDASLAKDQPRALIQMATGAGKTFTACTFSWRLLKHAKAKRILFLVDRNNLGDQTLKEYQNYDPPGAGRKFDRTYIVQHLHGNRIDPDAKVCITTIQRLYAMLRGEELDETAEEGSAFETWSSNDDGEIAPLAYNPAIPIEQFDFIVTDECHRSIYGLWRQVLEYFDAHLIGLTATPSAHTLGFFNRNLVAEYPYEQSVVDGVNVGFEVYRITTQVGEHGGTVDAKFHVPVRDRRTRAVRYKQLDADLPYSKQELDTSVTVPNQIRLVLSTFRDKLFTELFPGRSGQWVPKTLIFAKDDHHAEEIVKACWEVFGQGNEFAKKITYQTSEKPKELIAAFRVDPFPRIAVTVDMIATGTDIKPVECLIFMRDVKSQGYYEQMKGRGVRTLKDADLRQVTPDAQTKTRFVLIDAVGVTEGQKSTFSQPMERKRNVPFDKLIDQIAQGRRDEDAISSLAARLAALDRQVDAEDRQRITDAAKGITLRALAGRLLHAISPDIVEAELIARHGSTEAASAKQLKAVETALRDQACGPLDDAELRKLIKAVKKKNDIVIDELSSDELTVATYDLQQSQQRTTSFREFIETNKNELLALQILYSQPYPKRRLTYASIRELALKLGDPPHHLTAADVWQAYRRLQASLVRGAPSDKVLTDIISLVRFATGQADVLEPYAARVEQRFNLWIGRQKKAGRDFDEDQMNWLRAIRDYLAANVEIAPADLMRDQPFSDWGGVVAARRLFGAELNGMLDELTEALVA
jgi:type I restriction enzyme R subunit